MAKYKKAFVALNILSNLIAVFHFVLLSISASTVDTQSLVLNIIPYGLPIWIFSLAIRFCEADKPTWSRSGFLTMILFAISYIAMSAHVTLAYFYSNESFINVYFNLPVLYSLPMILFAILWAGTKNHYHFGGKKGIFGKFITDLPRNMIIVMVIHTTVLSVIEINRQINGPLSTSAPWWVIPLIAGFAYVLAIALSLLIRRIYNRVKSDKI